MMDGGILIVECWIDNPSDAYIETNFLSDPMWFLDETLEELLDIQDHVAWMLEQGIAPSQRFTVWIDPPHYWRDYWGECDVEYGESQVFVHPLPVEMVAALWGNWVVDPGHKRLLMPPNRSKWNESQDNHV